MGGFPETRAEAHRAIEPDPIPLGVLWHYTSPAAAMSILQSRALWAGWPTLMNDPGEMAYGASVIFNHLQENRHDYRHPDEIQLILQYAADPRADMQAMNEPGTEVLPSTFVLCASREMDDLGQYRAYGSHAIGFAADAFENRTWLPVQYSPDEHVNQADRLLRRYDTLLDDWPLDEQNVEAHIRAKSYFQIACAYMKAPAYAIEKEVRLVVGPDVIATGHHVGRLGITPHIEIKTYSGEHFASALRIGPGAVDPELAAVGAASLVQAVGGKFDVAVSPVKGR